MSSERPNFGEIDRVRSEFIQISRASAEMARTLGSRATQDAESLIALAQSDHAIDVSIAERNEKDFLLIKSFMSELPSAEISADSNQASSITLNFNSAAEAKVAESAIWLDEHYNYTDRCQMPEIGYLVGQKAPDNNSKKSESLELLFAFRRGGDWIFKFYQANPLMFDRINELARQKLAEPLDSESLQQYLPADMRGFRLKFKDRIFDKHILRLNSRIGLEAPKELISRNFNESRADDWLRSMGLGIRIRNADFKPSSADILNYNMDIHYFQLATLFGKEDAFKSTFGNLSTAQISGLASSLGWSLKKS